MSRFLAVALGASVGAARKIQADGGVYAVSWSPNGQSLAAGLRTGNVDIYDVMSGTRSQTCSGHSNFVEAVAFSPDGIRIASASDDKTVRIWSNQCKLLHTLTGHNDVVRSIAWSPDGRQLASGGDDGAVYLWDAATGEVVAKLASAMDLVLSVAYASDGSLASGDADGGLRGWNSKGALMWAHDQEGHQAHDAEINSVAFSPNAKELVSAGSDGYLKVWDTITGDLLKTVKGASSLSLSVSYSPDGSSFAISDWKGQVTIFDESSGSRLQSFAHSPWTRSVAYSPSGADVASGSDDGTIGIWSVSQTTLV